MYPAKYCKLTYSKLSILNYSMFGIAHFGSSHLDIWIAHKLSEWSRNRSNIINNCSISFSKWHESCCINRRNFLICIKSEIINLGEIKSTKDGTCFRMHLYVEAAAFGYKDAYSSIYWIFDVKAWKPLNECMSTIFDGVSSAYFKCKRICCSVCRIITKCNELFSSKYVMLGHRNSFHHTLCYA